MSKKEIENTTSHGIQVNEEIVVVLGDKQKQLCRRLDQFYIFALNNEDLKPSELFRGALYLMMPIHRIENPDWMAQAAHSLRDILYPFYKKKAPSSIKRKAAFNKYGSQGKLEQLDGIIGQYFGFLSDIAHHNMGEAAKSPIIKGSRTNPIKITEKIFMESVAEYVEVLLEALRRQIDVHQEIDDFLKIAVKDSAILIGLLNINSDARNYFFSKTDENWLAWLWENGYLDEIKKIPFDSTHYTYRSPELGYLVRVADKKPEKVVDIILAITILPEHFNPELIDRFIWICQRLPAEQLARIVSKIRDEKWVLLMERFNRWGFEYEKLMDNLIKVKDFSNMLVLAEAIFEVRPVKEGTDKEGDLIPDNPFCFDDLKDTKIFKYLAEVDDAFIEPALGLVSKILGSIVNRGKKDNKFIFEIDDEYSFYDVDFFNIDLEDEKNKSYRGNMRSLAATMAILTRRALSERCDSVDSVKRIYGNYLQSLPSSQSIWRYRLFAMSLCPNIFKDELKEAFLKIFDYEEPWQLIHGTEYEKAIRISFSILATEERRSYISRAINMFGNQKEDWQKNMGWRILSNIYDNLCDEERRRAGDVFGRELDPEYKPKSIIGDVKVGFVNAKAPIDQEKISELSIVEIISRLKTDWSPAELRKLDKEKDFLKPLNADGMSEVLKADIEHRFEDYIFSAALFFDRDHLDSHYTYAFLTGVNDIFRNKKYPAKVDWSGLVKLLVNIVESAKKGEFNHGAREREIGDTWLVSWESVHDAMADVLQGIIKENSVEEFAKYRGDILETLEYLLTYPDPEPETEFDKIKELERDPQSGEERYTGSDPFTAAINSVRGRAFQAFILFMEKDGLSIARTTTPFLSSEVKRIYKECLNKEKTQAVMFLFGHCLPFSYYQDREWIRNIVPTIFSADPKKKDLYLAAWEGYLTQTLYLEFFEEFNEYYRRAILFESAQYTARKYYLNLDKGLAKHIALAFIHISDFDISSDLFKLFWETINIDRHREFISFIGRYCISREKAQEWIKTNKINIGKLGRLWDWVLEHCKVDEVLSGFSLWFNTSQDVFDISWLANHIRVTICKTKGNLEWDHFLTESLPRLAEFAALDTIEILRIFFLGDKGVRNRRAWFYVDEKIIDVFKKLYENPISKEYTYKLIDDLLPQDNGKYWILKDVIKKPVDQ